MPVTFSNMFWKNVVTEKRMWPFLLAEFCSIMLIGVLIIANPARNLRKFEPTEEERKTVNIHNQSEIDSLKILAYFMEQDFPDKLAFAPNIDYAIQLATKTAKNLNLKEATTNYVPKETLARVVIGTENEKSPSPANMPSNLTLRIRFPGFFRTFHSSRVQSNMWLSRCTGSLTNSLNAQENFTQVDLYVREGFLQLQHSFFKEWMSGLGFDEDYKVFAHSFRYNTHESMCQPVERPNILSLLFYFIYFLPFLNLVWKYGREREENMLAHHWRYGCSKFKYWSAHFIISYLHFGLLSLVVLLLTYLSWLTKPNSEYKNSLDVFYLLIILVLSIIELIISAMVIVTLVPNAMNAVYCSIIVWILLYAVFSIVLEYSYEIESAWVVFCLVTFFNNGFAYGMRYLTGLTESSADKIWILFLILIASIVMKMIILSVVQHYKPGRYMSRLPYSFFGLLWVFQQLGFANCCSEKARLMQLRLSQAVSRDNYQFGPLFGEKLLIATRVAKSLKRFGEPLRDVVKKVSLTVFKGEITVLLGHNGAGKTTLISLFAGWRSPDDGSVVLSNFDIADFPRVIRKADVSMPNNTLYDFLTAAETLKYFVNIKGEQNRKDHYQEEVKTWLKTLKNVLTPIESQTKLVHEMSFDQKRLLTLCCVLCCGTKIVLLDEPTLHMQTPEQRYYWSVLQREKADRAIIVSTYSFREAETIGDRIAVLTDGVLKAYGTPMFLKTTFGIGFDLIVLKAKDMPSEPITELINEYIPDVRPETENENQLVYKISVDKRPTFQALLIRLHSSRNELGITDARLLTTDLSEVYMSLGRIKNRQVVPDEPQVLNVDYLPKAKRVKQQWSAMFFKKFTHQPSTIIPIFMAIFSFLLIFIIAEMLAVLRSRPENAGEMVLGYPEDAQERYLSKMKECKFIGIKDLLIGNAILRERKHSYTFTKDSFYCSSIPFVKHIYQRNGNMGHLYGALGIEVGEDGQKIYRLYINQHIFHSAPLVLNLLHNHLLESRMEMKKNAIARIISDPQPIPTPQATGLLDSELEHLYLPLAIGIILPLTICTFLFALSEERNNNILILMAVAGLRVDIYWLVNLIWDWCTFFVYTVLFQIVLVTAFYAELGFVKAWYIFLVSNVYSLPALASLYFISMFKFLSHNRAYLVASVIHVVSGIFAFVIYWDVFLAQKWFLYVLLFSPTFAMLEGVSNVYVMAKFTNGCENECKSIESCNLDDICKSLPQCCDYSYLDWGYSGILRPIVFLLLTTFFFVLLMFWVEIHRRETKFYVDSNVKKLYTKTYPYDDDDIVRMRDKIARSELRSISKLRLVVDQVESKIPRNAKFLSTISFEVDKKSIMAIYGTQHVGKTHLCRQIVGEDSFRFGDIYVRGIPVKYNVHDAWAYMGYCPQMNGVFSGFTPIEVLHFFCLLRGVPSNGIPIIVNDLSNLFGLGKVMRRRICRLSKGTQRKISIASAFVASNKVIILDEPTRGLPQWTRREIWNALRYMRSCGKTIVFTTTDMYECDALADTVLLIDDGEMLAYGGPHYLRHKHVIGFYLEVRLRRDGNTMEEVEENLRMDVENLHRFMIFMHSESILLNRVDNCLKFYIPVQNVNFNLLYGSLEKNRLRLSIAEYTVGQGNFEEVLSNISSKREHKRKYR